MGNSLCIEDKQPVPIANTLLYSNKNVKNFLTKYPILQSNLIINTQILINLNQLEEKSIQSSIIFRQNAPNAFGLYNGIIFQENLEINHRLQAWVYQGTLKKYMKHGQGQIIVSNGDSYVGEWCQDCFQGSGTYKSVLPRYEYTGYWQKSKKQGNGKIVFEQLNQQYSYEGPFINDKMHGSGKITYNDNSIYEGQLKQNLIDGHGKYTTQSYKYEGEWVKGLMQGVGYCQWYDQYKNVTAVYHGQYERGLKHGIGEYIQNKSGKIYKGEWSYGKINPQKGIVINLKQLDKRAIGQKNQYNFSR